MKQTLTIDIDNYSPPTLFHYTLTDHPTKTGILISDNLPYLETSKAKLKILFEENENKLYHLSDIYIVHTHSELNEILEFNLYNTL